MSQLTYSFPIPPATTSGAHRKTGPPAHSPHSTTDTSDSSRSRAQLLWRAKHLGNTGEVAGALTLQGGTLEVLGALNCGFKGPGTINMIDGTLTVPGSLRIARDPGAIGHINLNGGTISANNFLMREKEDAVGTMDVRGGMLTIDGNETSLVQGYIDNGWIIAYDGNGMPHLDS